MLILFLFLFWLFLFILVLTAPAECSSYSKLSEANRASGRQRGNVLKCDRNDLAVGWYRFTDAAGTRMPTSPVEKHHCGTHAPGWMNGQHPTKDDGAVKRQVCFNWNNNDCLWSIEISVRNCRGFYVYRLPKTPNCWLRYCGNYGHGTYSKLSLILRWALPCLPGVIWSWCLPKNKISALASGSSCSGSRPGACFS